MMVAMRISKLTGRIEPVVVIAIIFGCAVPSAPAQDLVHRRPTIPKVLRDAFSPPAELVDDLGDFRSVLKFDDGREVRSAKGWRERRAELLEEWHGLLGEWPKLMSDQKLVVLGSEQKDGFTQSRVQFEWLPGQTTDGYLLIPTTKSDQRLPAVITVFYEPETAVGQGKPARDFALQLAKRGFVTLSLGTTETTNRREYSLYYPSLNKAQLQPLSALACAAANAWHALANHESVDRKRIGIVGHSYGGKWAMFASCLFNKFACAAWSDPGIVFDTRPSVNYWEPWYLGYHPQPWRKRGVITDDNPAVGLYPRLLKQHRDLHELHVLMAPRPFLVSGGSEDGVHRWKALNHSVRVNRLLGVENRVAMTNRPRHSPSELSNAQIYAFFEMWLLSPRR